MHLSTLLEPAVRAATRERLAAFSPECSRQWGTLTPGGAVCHLSVCYRMACGGVELAPRTGLLQRTLFRCLALHAPLTWARGYPTLPEVKVGAPGVVPCEFAADKNALLANFDAFLASPALGAVPHPIFGPLTRWEWMRWGFLHADHHLRQFGL